MGLLDNFEKGLERAVNGAFAKTFRSGVQPVELASALRSELDRQAAVVSRDRILAPNTFVLRLSPADTERMQRLGSTLDEELNTLVRTHADTQGFSFAGPVAIDIVSDPSVATGTVAVDSQTVSRQVSWQGVAEIDGKRHTLSRGRTVIGRGSDADITIPDAGTSRRHVEILWDGERAMVRDLNSTNGTELNGRKVTEAALAPGSVIHIGRTDIVFKVVPQARPERPRMSASEATQLFDVERDR